MTASFINRIHAVASDSTPVKPFKFMPTNLTASAVVKTLHSLGLAVPTKLAAAAATGDLRSAEHRFALKDVDAALSNANVPITDRFRFKQALTHSHLLGR